MNQINEHIWAGSSSDPKNLDALRLNKISAILNVANDLDIPINWHKEAMLYTKCGLIDGQGNAVVRFRCAVDLLVSLIGDGHVVLVHCHEGKSRTCSVILAYLMRNLSMTYEDALLLVKEKRPQTDIQPALKELAVMSLVL